MNKWILRGDINFMAYGGRIIRQDENDPSVYEVLEVRTNWDTDALDEDEVYAWFTTVDISDEWIDWPEALACCGLEEGDVDDIDRVDAALSYYGIGQWSFTDLGDDDGKLTHDELAEVLKEYDAEEFAN